jgi:5-methylcytosine-specific restriction protein B
MPDPAIIEGLVGEAGIVDGVDVGKLLTAINQRIELLYDRDHTLGHAYLLSVESLADLRRIFLERVIPLLQEYFYDDWSKIALVLGCPFHEAKTKNPAPLLFAEELSVEKILGDVDDYETELRFQVNPSFASAEASGLPQFFNEVIRTGQR